jgi:peptidoglycan hydrolase-like protein with peptidoglycan-binding domain
LLLCAALAFVPAAASAELRSGSSGKEVRLLQQRLITLGLLESAADGDYGQKTLNAVREAQRLLAFAGQPVSPTGVADDATLALLFN